MILLLISHLAAIAASFAILWLMDDTDTEPDASSEVRMPLVPPYPERKIPFE